MNFWEMLILNGIKKFPYGSIILEWPNGNINKIEASQDGPNAKLIIHDNQVAKEIIKGGSVKFAELYISKKVSTDNLTNLIHYFAVNNDQAENTLKISFIKNLFNKFIHFQNKNTKNQAKKNISRHYDLGNKFYEYWLDKSMTYSSAIFHEKTIEIEDAQNNKYKRLAELSSINNGDEVLEIGCGWGGFSEFVARDIGAQIHGLTLSQEQLVFAKERYQKAGLDHLATAAYTDYRDSKGQFDKIVSIEMFEAVGEENWDTYFQSIQQRLASGGVAALQIITIDDQRFQSYRKGADFIQRYIFPGGFLPSQSALGNAIKRNGFELTRSEFFGQSYARTCATWNKQFQHAWPEIQSMGYSLNFKRMWEYYLSYCEAGFLEGCVDVGIFEIKKST